MKYYRDLKKLFSKIEVFNSINSLLEWDMATVMPKGSRISRISQINVINENKKEIFEYIKKKEILKFVDENKLREDDRRNFSLMKKKIDYFIEIPIDLINRNSQLSFECEGLWRDARLKNDFNVVKKKLSELLNVITEKSKILSDIWEMDKYDCLISLYDDSFDSKEISLFFNDIEKFIKNKMKIILTKQKERKIKKFKSLLTEEEQFKLSKYFMKKFGFDFNRGRIDKSLHPFCGGYKDDIRITTRFDNRDSFSCFEALMHETGHAIYEFGLPKKWKNQPIGKAAGMSLHESQSLFIEMQIVKSMEFSIFLEKIFREKFNKKGDEWNFKNLFNLRTEVKKNYIRVDADEVSYPLHIIHRFNIEKLLISKGESINYLPEIWNKEFKRIFDLNVTNDNEGCLQDIHWFSGTFGYFPSYFIGAMISAQIKYFLLNNNQTFKEDIQNGNFKSIVSWLKNNIHYYGRKYKINELLIKKTGRKLSTTFYKKHITDRYLN
tara:strand:+ start:355 stop:1836 length:1482 start_codon:yes stop_codon:yes gene_type:complete